MSIDMKCSTCGTAYSLPEAQRGKRVRCRTCAEVFVPGGESPAVVELAPAALEMMPIEGGAAAPERERRDEVPALRRPRIREDDEQPSSRRGRDRRVVKKYRSSNTFIVVSVCVAVGVILLILLGGVVGWVAMRRQAPPAAASQVQPNFGPPAALQKQMMQWQPPNPPPIPPPNLPAAPAAVDLPPNPFAEPTSIDDALRMLKEPHFFRRQRAAAWLSEQALDEARQREVALALDPLLTDPDLLVREAVLRALQLWATADNVPSLLKMLEGQARSANPRIYEVLGKLKDPRALAPVAAMLPNVHKRRVARQVLEAYGSKAEGEVAIYLTNKDVGTRMEACKILGMIGTAESLPALEKAKADFFLKRDAEEAIRQIKGRE